MSSIDFQRLPRLIHEHYGSKVDVVSANDATGEVAFVLYESFLFKCGIDPRHGRFGLVMLLDGIAVRTFFGKRVTMENDEASIRASLNDIERFCRLRLPDAFLGEFDAATRNSEVTKID
ncbi:hypothetical protein [Leifsonia sp. P73]|uniref:hypothetical protein n=1 Tax=Leifsonia sp. P73 TaxID=3423959 RepID=UPI003DA52443